MCMHTIQYLMLSLVSTIPHMGSVYVCIDIHDRRVHLHRHVCAHDTIPHVVACICDPSYHRLCTMQSRYSSCTFASIHVKQTCKSIKETYKVANESKNRSSSKQKNPGTKRIFKSVHSRSPRCSELQICNIICVMLGLKYVYTNHTTNQGNLEINILKLESFGKIATI